MATLFGTNGYDSNSSGSTHGYFYWTALSATRIRLNATFALGASTGLGTGNSRNLTLEVRNAAGTVIGSGSVEVKDRYTTWSASNSYYGQLDVDIPYSSGVTLKLTAKLVVGAYSSGIESCRWDAVANTNYPSQVSISWPVYNTAPTWPVGAAASLNLSGIIPENTSSLTVSWSAATDAQGDSLKYDVYRIKDTIPTKITPTPQSARSIVDNIGAGNAGAVYYYNIYAYDGALYSSGPLTTPSVTKNVMTKATLNHSGAIAYATTQISMSRTTPSNTNGNTSFSYSLACAGITVYNPTVDLSSVGNVLKIWRTGDTTPAGPYIKFDDIKTLLASSSFTGTLVFTLTTTNAYSTSASDTESVSVDLRTNPTGLGAPSYSGGYTIASTLRYLPGVRAITLNWTAATDPLGTSITYDVQYKLTSASSWTQARTALTTNTTTITPPSADTQQAYNVRVIAKSAYAYQATANGATLLIDKYLRPIIKLMGRVRTIDSVTLDIEIEHRSSFNDDLAITGLSYTKQGGAAVALGTGSNTVEFTYSEAGVFDEYSSYSMVLTLQDNAGTPLSAAAVTAIVLISSYTPMLSIREQGVGINDVNDGTGNYIVKARGKINSVSDPDGYSGFYENGVKVGAPTLDALPVGFCMAWWNDTAPSSKWLFGEGQSLASYPDAAAIFGASLPDTRGRVLVGKAASGTFAATKGTAGSETKTLGTTEIPSHTHTINHDHEAVTSGAGSSHSHSIPALSGSASSAGAHTHQIKGINTRVSGTWDGYVGSSGCSESSNDNALSAGAHTHTVTTTASTSGADASHTHSVNLADYSGSSGSAGSGVAFSLVQPSIVCRWIFKVKA